jgi:hypothetical protein
MLCACTGREFFSGCSDIRVFGTFRVQQVAGLFLFVPKECMEVVTWCISIPLFQPHQQGTDFPGGTTNDKKFKKMACFL